MRIILVDDEPGVLQAHLAILKTMPGNEIRVAATAKKAVEHAAALGGVDLLITDVVMEPTDGFTLRDELTALYPAVQAVFVSGYDLSDHADKIHGATVLPKPLDATALREIVDGVAARLGSKSSGAAPAPTPRVNAAVPAGVPVLETAAAPQAASHVESFAQPPAFQSAAPAVPVDQMIGVQLGDYRVQRLLGHGQWGRDYSAIQQSVNRRVGMRVLEPEWAKDEQNRTHFLADAQAKAAVQHPLIMSVFEADERNGMFFYTHEFLEGATMQERIEGRQFLDEKTALQVVKATAEALQYLWSHNLPHAALDASTIRLGSDNIARLENLATATADPAVTPECEIRALGAMMEQLVPERARSGGFRAFLEQMCGRVNPVNSWVPVLQAVKALEPKVIPQAAAKIKAADAAAIRAVEANRRAKRNAFFFSLGTLLLLLAVLVYVYWKFGISNERKLDVQVTIPAGEYFVGSKGPKVSLPAFEIDQYEVTIGEYAKFIEWCEKNQARAHEFDHPQGDRFASHVNQDVKTLILNASIRGGRVIKQGGDPGAAVDLNCPMVAVTYWDAYAYAHWRGKILEGGALRDLPTEEEWEAAARGKNGYKYPWGDELKLKNFNSNQGYQPTLPGSKKNDDGYNYWSPVDAFAADKSELNVRDMAGNVCEWVYRKEGNREIPVLKGGSFASDPVAMWERITKIPAEDAWYVFPAANKPKATDKRRPDDERLFVGDDVTPSIRSFYIGFRTVKRK